MRNVNAFVCAFVIIIALRNIFNVESGFACLSNPCVHGVCLDDLNTTYSCYCIDGYTGVQCQTNWDECWSNPCQNGGVCQDGIAAFNCTCPPGFIGDLCEENLNECLSNPCQNNATCLDAANGYFCSCPPGFAGIHCDVDVAVCNLTNETRCANGGVCIEGPGVTFNCRCPDGWTGFFCELEVDECMSHPCQNGAVCVDLHADYECACLFGYAGRNCEETVLICEDNPCRNDALCLMEEEKPVCYCVPDYHGDRCQFQYDECKLSNNRCLNGGSCIDGIDGFTCSCPPKLTGIYCECLIVELKGGTYLDCSYITSVTTITTNATITTEFITTTSTIEVTPSTTEITISTITETTSTEVPITTTTEIDTTTQQNFTTTALIETTTNEVTTQTSTEFETETSTVSTTLEATTITTTEETPKTTTTEETPKTTTTEETPKTTTTDNIITTTEDITETSTQTTTPVISTILSSTETETTEIETTTLTSTDTTIEISSPTTPTTITPNITITTLTSTTLTTSTTDSKIDTDTTSSSTISSTSNTFSTTTDSITLSTPSTITTTDFTNVTDFITSTTEFTTTTEREIETTTDTSITEPPFDCSKSDQSCLNGGTCVYSEGFRCVCPYDYSGIRCTDLLGIQIAAFNGNSFILHQVHTTGRMQVEFSARTSFESGILFYANIQDTYMALFMEQAHLKFKFSCGYQTMLLSELNKPVNNGNEIRISALLTFSEDLKYCNASIKLNDTLTMSGAQIAKFETFYKPKSWLYLGGLNEKANPIAKLPGFIGCMSDLFILGKKIHIFKDAEDAFGISECASLACLSNPCINGGNCTPLPGKSIDKYFCKCPNGYVGKQCEKSVCDNNPCKFGATCLPFTGSGYICLCPFGKHGHFCENDIKISKTYYSSSVQGFASYTSHPIPRSTYKNMFIKFKITPSNLNQISLLMFMGQQGQHDFYSDHMAVSFVKGYIMLTWNLGSGPRRIFTTKPIPADKASYEIQLGRLGRRAWLNVEHIGNVSGRSQGSLTQLDVEPFIYFGGYKTKDFEGLPHDLPLHGGFAGCIFDMELKIGDVVIALQNGQISGRAVGQCGTTECYEGVCQNHGACLYHGGTFTCLCQDNFYGPLCSAKNNFCDRNSCTDSARCLPMIAGYECDCPLEKKGQFCNEDESLTDISFTGTRSYIILPSRQFEVNKFNFDFELRPFKDGLVAFIGTEESFFSLTLLSGLLELKIKPRRQRTSRQEVITLRSNKILRWGSWHQVKIQIYGRKIYLFVANIVNTASMQVGDILDLSNEKVYLGGLPDLSQLPQEASSEFPTLYKGCLRKLFLDTTHIVLNKETILQGQNVEDCDGTPCGGDYCANGGTCWLDPNLKPHCNCPEPYYGDNCQKIYDCIEHKCKNDGYCLEGRCVCKVGYVGALCEIGLTIKSPKFVGRSYLYVNVPDTYPKPSNTINAVNNNTSSKKRNSFLAKQKNHISIQFVTASDGLLLFAHNSSTFAMGLQNGKLTLIDDNESLELLSAPILVDGFPHLLQLKFRPFRVFIDSTEYDVGKFSSVEFDRFYLGGVPLNVSNSIIYNREEYNEHELPFGGQMFDGCIDNLSTTNLSDIVTDFNSYSGENIAECNHYFN